MTRRRFLTSILLVSIIAVLFLPFYTNFFLYPSFTRHLQKDAEKSATELANHLIHYIEEPESGLGYEQMNIDFVAEVDEMHKDFGCEKVKIFAPNGEIIHSTDPADIGKINNKEYFKPVITQGKNFTKIVQKNNKTAEGRIVTVDVVETYVPLKFGNRIVGAGEVYFDITEHRKNVAALVRHSSIIVYLVTCILLIAVF